MKITRRVKVIGQEDYFKLYNQFISDSSKGFRLRSIGKAIKPATITNYFRVQRVLEGFVAKTNFELKLFIVSNLNKEENETARRYTHRFYNALSEYLYNKGCYDNYVGFIFTNIKTFYNYLINEQNINIGPFHRKFFIHKEKIQIVVLKPEQLNYLITDKEFEKKLSDDLIRVKDIFVFGCTVALRACDLLRLQPHHLKIENGEYILNVISLKTRTKTSIKLPEYAIQILMKYYGKYETLLPQISLSNFNLKLKLLAKAIDLNEPLHKVRSRRGEEFSVYKDQNLLIPYKIADHITSHTMRRTAITSMLLMGVSEQVVRKISGHSPTSSEFYKYVKYSEEIINTETDRFFENLIAASFTKNDSKKKSS
jgi:integrase